MNARWLSVGLTVAMCGCSSAPKDAAPQPAAAEGAAEVKAGCACPEGACACAECKAGDTASCSCAAK